MKSHARQLLESINELNVSDISKEFPLHSMVKPLRSKKRPQSSWTKNLKPIAYEVINYDELDGEKVLVLKTGDDDDNYEIVYTDEVVKVGNESKNEEEKKINSYQIVDGGVDRSDYFPGIGTGSYDEVCTGIGNSFKEALDDAIEQCAMNGWAISDELENELKKADDKNVVPEDSEDTFYYVGLRVK